MYTNLEKMHTFISPISIDIYKFILYIEPSFFIFFGKAGAFKTILFYPILLHCICNVLVISVSPVVLFNRFLKYNVVPVLNKGISFVTKKKIYFISSNSIYSMYVYHKYIYKYFFFIRRLILQIIFSIHRGWVKRLRLVGIGYKLYYSASLLILKLGYSKCIFFLLPFDLRFSITGRKKRGFSIFSIHKLGLTLISRLLLQLRIPNIYTGKGIRMRSTLFSRKLGKKSLF